MMIESYTYSKGNRNSLLPFSSIPLLCVRTIILFVIPFVGPTNTIIKNLQPYVFLFMFMTGCIETKFILLMNIQFLGIWKKIVRKVRCFLKGWVIFKKYSYDQLKYGIWYGFKPFLGNLSEYTTMPW